MVVPPRHGAAAPHLSTRLPGTTWSRPPVRGARATRGSSPAVTSAVRRYLAVSGLVLLAVGVPTGLGLSAFARELAVTAAIERADRFADRVVGPMLGSDLDGRPSEVERTVLDEVVRARVAVGSLHGVRVWDHEGQLVYTAGQVDAQDSTEAVSMAAAHEGGVLFQESDLVHVIVAADVALADPLAVEVLVPMDEVLRVEEQLRWPFVAAGLVGLLLLTAGQLPLAISMARRVQTAEQSRQMLLTQAVASSELERRRLAHQLHDDVLQDLAGLGYALDSMARHVPHSDRGMVVAARELVQGDVAKLRDILADLYPSQIDHDQLEDGLEALAESLRASGTHVILDLDVAAPLDRERATLLHRVARESMTNVAKHADALQVQVSVRHSDLGTEMRIRDDGRGFHTEQGGTHGHVGLRLVHDLVQELGGALHVASRPDAGTVVSLRLPPA